MTSRPSPIATKSITRRDFVNGTLAAAGATLASGVHGCAWEKDYYDSSIVPANWYGYGGVGDYQSSHGNTPEAVTIAHRIRDGAFDDIQRMRGTDEEYDLVIVGCGMAGLGAALEYDKRRQPGQTCLMLDNHSIFGGEAKENEFDVNGTTLIGPQGANGFFVPEAVTDFTTATGDARYYAELDIPRNLPYREYQGESPSLRFCKDNYGYLVIGLQERISVGHHFAATPTSTDTWAVDMWQNGLRDTPLTPDQRRSLLSWYSAGQTRSFDNDNDAIRYLDSMSYQDFVSNEMGLGQEGARYGDLFLASAAGLGSDAISAYAASRLPMPGFFAPLDDTMERQSFPGGNSGYARYFLKALLPEAIEGQNVFDDIVTGRINFAALDRPQSHLRMRLDATAVSVSHDGPPNTAGAVTVVYALDGKLHRVRARAVIMATGGWINRHIVRDMPEDISSAYAKFKHAPFLVANVALTNWRFMERLGITAAVWQYTRSGFGYTCNIRRPMLVGRHRPPLNPEQPAILSFYTPFFYPGLSIDEQIQRGRTELLATSYPAYEAKIIAQMNELFGGAGFNPTTDVAGIILNRWGHAYSVPFPGFFGGNDDGPAPRDIVRQGYGRVAFAHSELDGLQHWGPAADEGRRAFGQISSAMSG